MKTVNIPDELHAAFKSKTALEGLQVKETAETLIQMYVDGKIILPKKEKSSI